MELIRRVRDRRGLSQRALARRAGLSFRGVQLIESPDHDARLSSLEQVVHALGLPAGGLRRAVSTLLLEPPDSLFCASLRILEDGERSWRGHLMNCVDEVRRSASTTALETPPAAELPERLQALAAGVAEALAAECGAAPPGWTGGVGPLERPWFVSGYENLKAAALVESPVPFRSRNVFVLANFLERV
ncbi:MAG: helix-turn-helix transcriptional regulator [Acidobacteria bacterium]|nr:helix-turn-helix transcriptional regulator [Acidobacteriota bacterium]